MVFISPLAESLEEFWQEKTNETGARALAGIVEALDELARPGAACYALVDRAAPPERRAVLGRETSTPVCRRRSRRNVSTFRPASLRRREERGCRQFLSAAFCPPAGAAPIERGRRTSRFR